MRNRNCYMYGIIAKYQFQKMMIPTVSRKKNDKREKEKKNVYHDDDDCDDDDCDDRDDDDYRGNIRPSSLPLMSFQN